MQEAFRTIGQQVVCQVSAPRRNGWRAASGHGASGAPGARGGVMDTGEEVAIFERDQVVGLLESAATGGALVEVTLDREAELFYGARFLATPGFSLEGSEQYLILSALEPALGNVKIRRAREVWLGFPVGNCIYQARCAYLRSENFGELPGLALSLPRVLRLHNRRLLDRVTIDPALEIRVVLKRDNQVLATVTLSDLSQGGLGFQTAAGTLDLEPGTEIRTTLEGSPQLEEPLSLKGIISSRARVREGGEGGEAHRVVERFGLRFGNFTVPQAMRLDRLVKSLRGRCRPGDADDHPAEPPP